VVNGDKQIRGELARVVVILIACFLSLLIASTAVIAFRVGHDPPNPAIRMVSATLIVCAIAGFLGVIAHPYTASSRRFVALLGALSNAVFVLVYWSCAVLSPRACFGYIYELGFVGFLGVIFSFGPLMYVLLLAKLVLSTYDDGKTKRLPGTKTVDSV